MRKCVSNQVHSVYFFIFIFKICYNFYLQRNHLNEINLILRCAIKNDESLTQRRIRMQPRF